MSETEDACRELLVRHLESCHEGGMECNGTGCPFVAEMQDEHILLRDAFVYEFRYAPEPESLVVGGIAYEHTPVCSRLLEESQTLMHECLADALPLVRRQHGDGAEPIPVLCPVGNADRRQRCVTDDSAVDFGYERYGERIGRSQSFNDVVFSLSADGVVLEGSLGDLSYCVDI